MNKVWLQLTTQVAIRVWTKSDDAFVDHDQPGDANKPPV